MPKDYRMKAEPAIFKLTGQSARLVHTVTVRALKRNWPLIAAYVVVTGVGIVASYFTSEWNSVALSLVVAVLTFVIGLRMLQEVVSITREVR